MRCWLLYTPEYKRYVLLFLPENVVNLYKFLEAGQLRQLPFSYTHRVTYVLDLWFDSHVTPSNNVGGATGSGAAGATSITADGVLNSGDVEMTADPTEQSNTTEHSDPLIDLALQLKLISPETPLLSVEDRHDLALLDQLTQTHTRVEQVLGLETEIAATEKWNFDAVTQLMHLAKEMSDIPFTGGTELVNLEPTSATGLASKGKGRLEGGPKKTLVSDLLEDLAGRGWAGFSGEVFSCPCPI